MTLLGAPSETLAWHASPRSLGALPIVLDSRGKVLAPAPSDASEPATTEGNRSVLVPRLSARVGAREMHLSVKGCGALAPMYGEQTFRRGTRTGLRRITRESWMGEAPYGGQSEAGAMAALALSRMATDGVLAGFHLCPTIEVVEVPDALVDREIAYRRHAGTIVQEQRLVPSDVRLFAASDHTLGRHTDAVLAAFGVRGVDALESFLVKFLATSCAALTLFARTCTEREGQLVGLDLDDVWLDKDAVLAPDGALFFVDLEALEWTPAWPSVDARVRRQVGRNAYEVLYAVDALLDVRERWRGRRPSPIERRAALRALLEMALDDDPFVRAEPRSGGLDLAVHASGRTIVVPLLDDAERDEMDRARGETRCE